MNNKLAFSMLTGAIKIAFMLLSSKRRTFFGSLSLSLCNRNKSSSPVIMKLDEEAFTSSNLCKKLRKHAPI